MAIKLLSNITSLLQIVWKIKGLNFMKEINSRLHEINEMS